MRSEELGVRSEKLGRPCRVRDAGFVVVLLALLLSSCHRDDPFIGHWTVDRVNVDFNEQIATPEMVRQYGELEKGNVIEITKDTVLTFIADGDTLKGHCSLRGNQIIVEGKAFGRYENGLIETETKTPLGNIKVVYRK